MDVDLRSKSIEMKRSGIEMCFSESMKLIICVKF